MEKVLVVRYYGDVIRHLGRGILTGICDYSRNKTDWECQFLPAEELLSTSNLNDHGLAGLIVEVRHKRLAETLARCPLPMVNVSGDLDPLPPLPNVVIDASEVGKMAAEYFLGRGFRRFAYSGYTGFRHFRLFQSTFTERVEAASFACPILPPPTQSDDKTDSVAARRWLEVLQSGPLPVGVFCCTDELARKAVNFCLGAGLQVPDHAAIVGTGNNEIQCDLSRIHISTVRIASEQIGYRAAELLDKLMRGEAPPAEPTLIPPVEVITRRSSDALAFSDERIAPAVRFIRDRGGQGIDVHDLLAQTTLSRRSLEMRFRKALGRSPYQEIRRVQHERAQLLMCSAERAARQIAGGSATDWRQQLEMLRAQLGLATRQYRRKKPRGRRPHDGQGPGAQPTS